MKVPTVLIYISFDLSKKTFMPPILKFSTLSVYLFPKKPIIIYNTKEIIKNNSIY
jgi:hypothetical protein